MKALLSILGPIVVIVGLTPYLLQALQHKIKPRISSWLTWSLIAVIATIAAISAHAYASAFLSGGLAIINSAILLASLRGGEHGYNRVDAACQVISIFGVVAWLYTSNPLWAILFAILADLFGAIPTFYHTWLKPYEEAWLPFLLSGVGSILSLLAVQHSGFSYLAFPIYMVLIDFSLALTILVHQFNHIGSIQA